jgi:peptidoglycan/xylan/chitin deacetylase (PgdA/CDA1 family)
MNYFLQHNTTLRVLRSLRPCVFQLHFPLFTSSPLYLRICFFFLCVLCVSVVPSPPPVAAQSQPTDDSRPAWDGTLRRIRVPILMYHYVSELPPDWDATRRELTVSPAQFRSHLDYLFYNGYTPISLYTLDDALLTGQPLPAKSVILTFDDGYIDHYVHVFPALQQFGFTATFFIITSSADENRPGYLTWEQIAEMATAGMSMEAHTKTHRELLDLTYDQVVYEVLGSIESLAYYTRQPPRMFSYPVGRYDALTLDVVTQLGVWRAVTTERGMLHTTDNRLLLSRLRVPGGADADMIAALLGGS